MQRKFDMAVLAVSHLPDCFLLAVGLPGTQLSHASVHVKRDLNQ